MKRIAQNFLLLATSLGIALGAGGGLCRLFIDPSDYLTVTLEEDEILGYRVIAEAVWRRLGGEGLSST